MSGVAQAAAAAGGGGSGIIKQVVVRGEIGRSCRGGLSTFDVAECMNTIEASEDNMRLRG